MTSVIFRRSTVLSSLLLFHFSLIFFWRGHHLPGGGFIGGLLASGAAALIVMAYSGSTLRRILIFSPIVWLCIGLLVAATAGMMGFIMRLTFFEGLWTDAFQPLGLDLIGTPVLFDFGVYLVVVSMFCAVLLALEEFIHDKEPS